MRWKHNFNGILMVYDGDDDDDDFNGTIWL
jgi:hypothetical protein